MSSLVQTSQVIVEHAQAATEVVQQVAEHAEHVQHAAGHSALHSVNWVTLLAQAMGDTVAARLLSNGEKVIFTLIVVALIAFFCFRVNSRLSVIPDKIQLALEAVVLMLDGLVCGITGTKGRAFTPFVGTLFIYILVSNFYGLIPLQNSATAYITTTAPLAVAVFFYVQWVGVTKNGFFGYIYHLAGSPKDLFGYVLILLNFPLHVVGEFAKPLSLMFRLYGNVMAGHILVAVFLGLGIEALRPFGAPIGVPMHFPFLFLEILVCLIQAFVFALLAAIYIGMMLPHDQEHDHEHGVEHDHDLVAEERVYESAHGETHAH